MRRALRVTGIVALTLAAVWIKLEGSILPRRSTRAYWRLSNLPRRKRIEGYIYGARTSLYLKPATWPWLLPKDQGNEPADTYHGKVLTGRDAARLITVDTPVELTDLEHVIPYPVARDIIFSEGVQRIAVLECPCRAQKNEACEPKDVCLVVGEPFASFVVDHQPGKARHISADEALAVLAAEERRGHIHTAWFKDVMHNRFYAICNCCRCCCLGMQSFMRDVPRLVHSGYRPQVDYSVCVGCGTCAGVCPFGAVIVGENGTAVVDDDACMGCALCVSHCTEGAIALEHAPDKGIPLAIDMLLADSRQKTGGHDERRG
ncbi:MAG: ATP-binding protein [Candidatus Aquicultor sp.]